jgi:ABC-2 type transport system permease protein
MEAYYIFWRNVKWRFLHPETIIMTLMQPLVWLLLFSTMFGFRLDGGKDSLNYTAYLLPGILIMVVITGAGMSGISNYYSKRQGSFYRIYTSPVRRSSIVLGHILDAAVLTFLEAAILFILSIFLSVKVNTGVCGFFLIFVLLFFSVFFVSGISYCISIVLKDENSFIAMINTFMLPLFFVSTALMPFSSIPKVFRIPVRINPFSYVINSIRNLVLDSSVNSEKLFLALGILLPLCVLSFLIAVRILENDAKHSA